MDTKDTYTKVFLQAAEQPADEETIKKMRPLWWYNVRSKGEGGLRLTDNGIDFIQEQADIKTYKVDFPNEFAFTPQTLIWLDKFINCPYYVTKRYIIVMTEKAAFELYLFSGDIRKMGAAKALSKRLNQESTQE